MNPTRCSTIRFSKRCENKQLKYKNKNRYDKKKFFIFEEFEWEEISYISDDSYINKIIKLTKKVIVVRGFTISSSFCNETECCSKRFVNTYTKECKNSIYE